MDLVRVDDDFWPRPSQVPICWVLALIIFCELAAIIGALWHRS